MVASPLRGELRRDEPLARHTTWRVGGPARRFYRPADLADLGAYIAARPGDEPLLWLGLGSNVLVRDGGFAGSVIAPAGRLDGVTAQGRRLRAEAGATCAKVAREGARAGLGGLEFLCGIPGTIGGALAMNAGCFGGETWDRLVAVETLDRQGVRRRRTPAEYQVAYRRVVGPAGEWFVACEWELGPGEPEALGATRRALLARRGASQPTRWPSAGSVFRNPPGDYAARLIEAAGLKGRCCGDACVAHQHANFILNQGHARAADIETLMAEVAAEVATRFGVTLVPEVVIVGEPQA